MKKIALFLLFTSLSIVALAQKPNKIIYGDLNYALGTAFVNEGDDLAAAIGASFYYQHNHNLYSFRYNLVDDLFGGSPSGESVRFSRVHEFGLLYGYRWLFKGSSIALSGGVSLNHYALKLRNGNFEEISNQVGFPVEASVRFFKKRKRRFRAYYGLIPIGRPTNFGRSLGFKLSANFAERGFFLIGFTYGLGVHKYY
jgi:hypothetical protein